jgi:hypothetical protein
MVGKEGGGLPINALERRCKDIRSVDSSTGQERGPLAGSEGRSSPGASTHDMMRLKSSRLVARSSLDLLAASVRNSFFSSASSPPPLRFSIVACPALPCTAAPTSVKQGDARARGLRLSPPFRGLEEEVQWW